MLLLLVLMLAAGAVVFVVSLRKSMDDQARILMRDMGRPFHIFAKAADPRDYFLSGTVDASMPEQTLYDLHVKLTRKVRALRHLTAHLFVPVTINGADAMLAGTSPELDLKRKPIPTIKEGAAELGSEIARRAGLKTGDSFDVAGRTFRVAVVKKELGTIEDYHVVVPLKDAQATAKKPAEIHMIRALPCLCKAFGGDVADGVRQSFPNTRVVTNLRMAVARKSMRERVGAFGLMAVVILAVIAGGLAAAYAALNVRERRGEVAILMAIGARNVQIFLMFFVKLLALGVLGGLTGYGAGVAAMATLGPKVFKVPVLYLPPVHLLTLGGACAALVLIFGAIPILLAVGRDPAETLQKEFP